MNKLRNIACTVALCIIQVYVFAQDTNAKTEDPTDFMRSEGKLYVVMAVVVVILIGLFIYLINLDRKIKALEKKG
ncbi:CcmD family protein [Panacibacter ginsenosidivorans]|uniref:CcmD family protein n=1 Tax=Panacibacter ginsenosidivorans TaxID=1813871 RepID=A0A5B8V4F1_9BACT|nr:CcmD family protein [Panacibacter ginsenosidivorans]QEC66397.1 CcmD family protein [Panacibacter ginsenosidivorans]